MNKKNYNPMPTVTYGERTYKLKSRKTIVPDFETMESLEVLLWILHNTKPKGYTTKIEVRLPALNMLSRRSQHDTRKTDPV